MAMSDGSATAGGSIGRKVAAVAACVIVLGVGVLVALQFVALRSAAVDASIGAQHSTVNLMADQMAGGVKWGRLEVVEAVVDRVLGQDDGDMRRALVVSAAGETLVERGASDAAALAVLAKARETGGIAVGTSGDMKHIATPIGDVGALVTSWDESKATAAATRSALLSSAAGLVIAGLVIASILIFVTRAVTRPLARLTGAMDKLAAGDLDLDIPEGGRKDEVGRIAAALHHFRAAAIEKIEMERDADQARASREAERETAEAERAALLREQAGMVSALAEAVSRLAEGDLTHRVSAAFPTEHERLRDELNAAFESLQSSMTQIVENAAAVNVATVSITSAAEDLSARTESQAASLEQSAAAIEEIAATTRKTADGASAASATVARAKGEAESGGEVVRDAVAAMSEIEASSEKIGQIIGVIDEIAFQTNLLALNAGVEAARAGEAGRGFAVVASEVRALAGRSADAAKQIKDLILSSKEQVERGVKLVDGAGSALERIISGVSEINAAVGEIAVSAQEQASGLQEVSGAVGQMDQFTQQNAAMVEQVTSSVRSLSSQADAFAELVTRFKTGAKPHAKQTSQKAAPARSEAPKSSAPKPAAQKSSAATPAAAKPAPAPARAKEPARSSGGVTPMRPVEPKPKPKATPAAPAAPIRAAAGGGDAGWEEF